MSVPGLLLAAGAGRRMGKPKALVRGADAMPWSVSAARALLSGGCTPVYVVLGAQAAQAREGLVNEPVTIVEAKKWAAGMGESLKAGLQAVADTDADAVLIHLVDLPDIGPRVIARLRAAATPTALVRAVYQGRPSHPVVIGREHIVPLIAQLSGDTGAREYLAARAVSDIECGDLATGRDIDTLPTGQNIDTENNDTGQ